MENINIVINLEIIWLVHFIMLYELQVLLSIK